MHERSLLADGEAARRGEADGDALDEGRPAGEVAGVVVARDNGLDFDDAAADGEHCVVLAENGAS